MANGITQLRVAIGIDAENLNHPFFVTRILSNEPHTPRKIHHLVIQFVLCVFRPAAFPMPGNPQRCIQPLFNLLLLEAQGFAQQSIVRQMDT